MAQPPDDLNAYFEEKIGGHNNSRPLRAVGDDERPPARPKIIVSNRGLDEITADAVDALVAANAPPITFTRAGMPTRLRADENDRPIIEGLNLASMRHRLAEVAAWWKVSAQGVVTLVSPPDTVTANVLAAGAWPFPALLGITEAPILRPDGTFVTAPGYDEATKLYHWTTAEYPPIPPQPTAAELAAAVQVIDDILADFPFDTPADRANAWGLLLTPLMRPTIPDQVPMALLDAPEPGTGKGLLANIFDIAATGRPSVMQTLPDTDEEIEKRITALLIAGTANICFDNVDGTIRSGKLAAALTTDMWSGRLLGSSVMVQVPNRATWIATGNNIDVGGDLARRCYRIRLDARQARPWARDGFRHPDLLAYVRRHRVEVVVALCTIIRAWWAAGKPAASRRVAIGTYTAWARAVGGVLEHAGVADFLANIDAFHAAADHEANAWEAFLTAWWERWTPGTNVTTADLINAMKGDSAMREALPDELSGHFESAGFAKRFGIQLRKRAGRHYGEAGLHIVPGPTTRHKTVTFSVHAARVVAEDPAEANSTTSTNANGAGSAGSSNPPQGQINSLRSMGAENYPHYPHYPRDESEPF